MSTYGEIDAIVDPQGVPLKDHESLMVGLGGALVRWTPTSPVSIMDNDGHWVRAEEENAVVGWTIGDVKERGLHKVSFGRPA